MLLLLVCGCLGFFGFLVGGGFLVDCVVEGGAYECVSLVVHVV